MDCLPVSRRERSSIGLARGWCIRFDGGNDKLAAAVVQDAPLLQRLLTVAAF